ncbi:MAG: YfhO family protein [Cellulomonas sp.]|uniref:YfhO family protein n=1 Tax=Cellulomonas sp. TaxID=40001 RepID=UPI0019ED847F|nr:YfhO family protein [Cellulomonas sp.]MBF0686357.1 YfhO family protein [Cellulomonas sp.]MBF0687201.1 YfhO family protein [Cellulomonas sp.]
MERAVRALQDPASRGVTLVTAAAWCGLALFVVVGVGSALLGRTVFAATDMLGAYAPWDGVLADTPARNPWPADTVDSVIPRLLLLKHALLEGDMPWWNPYVAGGSPLGSLPDSSMFSPLTLPWLLVPDVYAPGLVKLLEIAVGVGGMVLLLRRLGLGPASWAVGSLAFLSSGFMIAWTGWPQTRVAVLLPLLLWAVDRAVEHRRWRDALPLGAVIAAMLLGGFPAVLLHGAYASLVLVVVRLWHARAALREWLRSVAVATSGALLGAALSAWQLIPFALNTTSAVSLDRRLQSPEMHLDWSALATTFAPDVLGAVDDPLWGGSRNPVERLSYVGAVTLVLVVLALAVRSRRALSWPLVTAATGGAACVAVVYSGLALGLVQRLPGFDVNYVGRVRGLLGLVAAVCAAYGMERLVRSVRARSTDVPQADARSDDHETVPRPTRRPVPATAWVLGGAAAVALAVAVVRALRAAPHEQVGAAWTGLVVGVVLLAVAVTLLLVALRTSRRSWAVAAAVCLPLLMAVQAGQVAHAWWPRSPVSTFYPETPTHEVLRDRLGSDRFTSTGLTMLPGSSTAYGLRSATGHAFHTEEWRALLESADPDAMRSDTYSTMTSEALGSPALDRLAARYAVVEPGAELLGDLERTSRPRGDAPLLQGEWATSAELDGPVRGVRVDLVMGLVFASGQEGTLVLELVDDDDRVVARTAQVTRGFAHPGSVWMALPSVDEEGPLRVRLRVDDATVTLQTDRQGRWATNVVRADDDLVVVHTGDATVYERTTALPRFRWASEVVVEDDPESRVALLAGGHLDDDEAVLDVPPATTPTAGSRGVVRVLQDDDRIVLDVAADGDGVLVVADARRPGWHARVDGRPVELIGVDHALSGVEISAGQHTVELTYAPPGLVTGLWTTTAGVVVLLAAGVTLAVRRFRARGDEGRPARS